MTSVDVEIIKTIGILVSGITLCVCWTALAIANKKYRK